MSNKAGLKKMERKMTFSRRIRNIELRFLGQITRKEDGEFDSHWTDGRQEEHSEKQRVNFLTNLCI